MKKFLVAFAALTLLSGNLFADDVLDHGKYLVENVGMCADCHSPRDKRGAFIESKWLMGSVLAFKPTVPMPVWAGTAPALAGLPNYSDEQAMKLLTQGIAPTGQPLRPPMPPFRLNEHDARAVVTYLRSLKPAAASAATGNGNGNGASTPVAPAPVDAPAPAVAE